MYQSSEDLYIKNVKNAIRSIRLGAKTPSETNVGFNLNKLKLVNIGMYEDLMNDYKAVLIEYKKTLTPCLNCGHEFKVTKEKTFTDDLGKHTICPECKSSFDVD
jgi:predicted Zn-ribbon and HTH transcriptional regulator